MGKKPGHNFFHRLVLNSVILALTGSVLSGVTGNTFLPAGLREPLSMAVGHAQERTDRPVPTVHFPQKTPAPLNPVLTWTKVTGAVAYEIELFTGLPKNLDNSANSSQCFYATKRIFVSGFNVSLPAGFSGNFFYWRVRALDLDGNPIGIFSNPEKVYINPAKIMPPKPVPTSFFNQGQDGTLLYPVYAWIPVAGADKYEVEILDDLPENPNGVAPSIHRIDAGIAVGFDYYDKKPRISSKPLYWRVRGLDKDGNPVGVYSDAGVFKVNPAVHAAVATYGDSITHGGGSVSYSPADWEYSYQNYLAFPTINLGRSGDTSHAMVKRFDQDVVPFHPQYLIVLAGTNSLRGGTPAESVIADLKAIKEKCLANNIRPVFLTLPPINPDNIKKVFNESTVPDWQQQMGLVNDYIRTQDHIDVSAGMADAAGNLPTSLAIDGLHLDIEGKKKIAAAINANWAHVND